MEIQAAIVLVLVFFLMLAMSVPVSFSIISASLLTIIMFLTPGFGMFVSAQKIVSGIDSFTLLAVPFFVLAGLLMSSGGIAKRLINLAMLFLGRVPGSLAMTNIAGNAMFGSISSWCPCHGFSPSDACNVPRGVLPAPYPLRGAG